jgi:hypothetical protein
MNNSKKLEAFNILFNGVMSDTCEHTFFVGERYIMLDISII